MVTAADIFCTTAIVMSLNKKNFLLPLTTVRSVVRAQIRAVFASSVFSAAEYHEIRELPACQFKGIEYLNIDVYKLQG